MEIAQPPSRRRRTVVSFAVAAALNALSAARMAWPTTQYPPGNLMFLFLAVAFAAPAIVSAVGLYLEFRGVRPGRSRSSLAFLCLAWPLILWAALILVA